MSRPAQRSSRRDDERGSATLEISILFPVLLVLIFAVVQGALWFHGRTVALAAAQEGVRVARAHGATVQEGERSAEQFLAKVGGQKVLRNAQVRVVRDRQQVRVIVTGSTVSLLPALDGPAVTQSAAGPVERFTTPGSP